MARRTNFADAEYEPTDEDLAELIHEAFDGLREARARSLQAMWDRIAAAQAEARRAALARDQCPSPGTDEGATGGEVPGLGR